MLIEPLGIIHSPFNSLEDMPIQPAGAKATIGTVVVKAEYREGLADLEGFSHIYLLYAFHEARRTALTVVPFIDTHPRGVFATRSPLRPNHLGLSIVEIDGIVDNIITVRGIDILDGTPLLDIKPYIAAFDSVGSSRSGWMKATAADVAEKRSDGRFIR